MPSGMHTDLFSAADAFLSTAQRHEPGFGGSLGPWQELDRLDAAYAAYLKTCAGVVDKDRLAKAVRSVLSSFQIHQPGFGGMMGEWHELDTLGRVVESIDKAGNQPSAPEV